MKKTILYIVLFFTTLLLIINSQNAIIYAKESLYICSSSVIPSLFPFFVCSSLLVYSGFCNIISKVFSPLMKPLFNINPNGSVAFVLGLIGGYPIGAVTCSQLYQNNYITKQEAERLLFFCNNCGPLFILGVIGVSLYHNVKVGIILYISHILSSFICGILVRNYKKNSFQAPNTQINTINNNLTEIFSLSINNSVQNILSVCASIVFCGVIFSLICDTFHLQGLGNSAVLSLGEFVKGLFSVKELEIKDITKLIISASSIAFGGLSVHLQVISACAKSGLSFRMYFIGKISHAILSAFFTLILLNIFPVTKSVFYEAQSTNNLSASFCLSSLFVVITVLFLFSLCIINFLNTAKKRIKRYKKV